MESGDIIEWLMFGLALIAILGGLMGFLIKQGSRMTSVESEVEQLRDMVRDNAKMVHELAVTMSAISERLQLMLDMRND